MAEAARRAAFILRMKRIRRPRTTTHMATRALSTTCAYVCLAAAPVSHAPRSSKSAAPRVAASRAAARLSSKVPHPPPPEFGSLGECARTIRWLGSTAEAALCLNTTRPLDPMRRCAPGSCNALLGAAGMLTAVDTDRRTHTTPQRAATLCSREQQRVPDHAVGSPNESFLSFQG
jgi:hypothetical protein